MSAMLLAMHLPDHALAAEISAIAAVVAVAALIFGFRRASAASPQSVAMIAAVVFAGQMLNFVVPSLGVSGHFLGAATAGLLLGPGPGAAVISIVLLVQCLLFGDGGVSALGANVLNMAIVGCWSAAGVARWGNRGESSAVRRTAITALAGVASVIAAAAACGLQLALSGAADAVIPLLVNHLAIGLVEGMLTLALVIGLRSAISAQDKPKLATTVGWCLAATAIAFAPLASALPDGLDAVLNSVGVDDRASVWAAPLLGYAAPAWLAGEGSIAVVAAAAFGTAVVAALARCAAPSQHRKLAA